MHLSSTLGPDARDGLLNGRNKPRSASIPQTCVYPLNNMPKRRPSNETILSIQLNSRQQSKAVLNVDEV
jgi:hypothetical protein